MSTGEERARGLTGPLHGAVDRLDGAVGGAVEGLVTAHHRRRLERTGHGRLLDADGDPLWASGDPLPRRGNSLEVLVDGAEALPEIAAAVAKARAHVHIAGWHVTPGFALVRDGPWLRLRDLLAETARRAEVRVLLWAGPPLPLFRPYRADVRAVREELTRGTAVRCALDARERTMHCHHEKLVVVDGEVAFVGGIDLTSLAGDRYDTEQHPLREELGWHDVAARLRGPAVADVAAHFAQRWGAVTGERLDLAVPPSDAGDIDVQVVRTLPDHTYGFLPGGDFRILESYLRALRGAQRLVHLENQFLWSPEVVAVLVDKLRRPPHPDFRIVLVLPARPNNGADTTRGQLGCLLEADDGAGRVLACTITTRTAAQTGPAYVHAKVGIVDDRWLTVGSANLNEHSLFNDTEMNLVTCDPALARQTRLRLWAEHLELPLAEVGGEPTRLVDEVWRPLAREQLERLRRGAPRSHHLLELPGVSRRSRRLLGPLRGLVVDG